MDAAGACRREAAAAPGASVQKQGQACERQRWKELHKVCGACGADGGRAAQPPHAARPGGGCGSPATCGRPVGRRGRRRTIGCVHAVECCRLSLLPGATQPPCLHLLTLPLPPAATQARPRRSPLSLLPRARPPFLPPPPSSSPSSPLLPPSPSLPSSSLPLPLPPPPPQSFLPCRSAATSASPPPSSRRRYRSRIASSSSSPPPPSSSSSSDPSLSVAR